MFRTENDKYVRNMLHIRDTCTLEPKPSYVNLTTITFVFKVDIQLDPENIRNGIKNIISVKKTNSTHNGFIWTLHENKFYNQVTITCTDLFSKKSVKLFPNGSVHVTGCTSTDDCVNTMNRIKSIIEHITGTRIHTSDFEIFMINTNFSVNAYLNLNEVAKMANENHCIVSFKPETYSAVKIKFSPGPNMKRITASIFSSGCVLITGAKSLEEINLSYKFLLGILTNTRTEKHPVPKLFDIYLGMNFDQWRKKLASN